MTETEIGPNWPTVGAEVVEVYGHFRLQFGPIQRIAKVYANGRFVLEGSTTRWTPIVGRTAVTSGRGAHRTIRLVDDAARAAIKRAEEVDAARAVVRKEAARLEYLHDEDEILAAARAITQRGSGE